MKSTFISKEKNTAKFSMEFTAEEFENAVVASYKKNKGRFNVPGFRKGKATRSLIEKHYGADVFFEDAVNALFSENYGMALDELNLDVVDRPMLDLTELAKGQGFTATVTVDVYPEIEVKDYKGVEIEKVEAKVSDEDVDKEIESLRKRNSRMVLVDRAAKEGDTVLLDYMGFVGDVQFEGGTAERYPLKIGSGAFIPGFEEQLVGCKAGDEKEVKVTFPSEYHSEDLAGKEAVFKCKLHEIKEEELPELNDDFAKDVSEFDTMDELKADTRKNLEKKEAEDAENAMKDAVLEKVYEANEVDIPNGMVEEEIDNMVKNFDQQLRYQGLDLTSYFKYLQKDPKDFREELRKDAFKKVKTRVIVSAVADAEKLEADQADVDKELESMANQYKMEIDKLKEALGAENIMYLRKDLKMKKAVDFMFAQAKIK